MHAQNTEQSHDGLPQVSLRDNGIVHVDYGHVRAVTYAVIEHIQAEMGRLAPGRKPPVLITATNLLQVDREALDLAATARAERVACVLGGIIGRHFAKVFIWYHHPPFPTRVFADVGQALEWLRSGRD